MLKDDKFKYHYNGHCVQLLNCLNIITTKNKKKRYHAITINTGRSMILEEGAHKSQDSETSTHK